VTDSPDNVCFIINQGFYQKVAKVKMVCKFTLQEGDRGCSSEKTVE
jgi:hypothetical protein